MSQDPKIVLDGQGVIGGSSPAGTGIWKDASGNEVCSGAKSTFTTNTATNHNLVGLTPNFVVACVTGTATATSFGTFTATQYTPAETTPAATTAFAQQI